MNRLFWQAVLAFLALPGVVAFLIPLVVFVPDWLELALNWVGFVPLSVGIVLLLWTVIEFYVAGRGTLAPWTPPRELVVTGLYRYSRNPMYVAVVLILAGWAVLFRSWPLAVYAAAVALAFHFRVIYGEEPWLARSFGERWVSYKADVPRWFRWWRRSFDD